MVRVKYKKRYKKRKVEMRGHANAGPPGSDLVCAAASTLAITLKAALDANDIRYKLELDDGVFVLRCRDEAAAGAFNTVMCGMEALRTMYPEHIDVEYIGD